MCRRRVIRAGIFVIATALATGSTPDDVCAQSAQPGAAAAKVAPAMRLEHLQVEGRPIDLHALPANQVLRGKSGREISVGRLKQLQAMLSGAAAQNTGSGPVVAAAPSQSLKSLAARPAATRIALSNGRVMSAAQLKHVDGLLGKLREPRDAQLPPTALRGVSPKTSVGPALSLAEALKRPGNEPIQVGKRVFTVAALREIDKHLRADPRDPRGLAERAAAARKGTGNRRISTATQIRFKVATGTSIATLLQQSDDTVLVSPHGRTLTVRQLKAYLQQNHLTAEQAEARLRNPSIRSKR